MNDLRDIPAAVLAGGLGTRLRPAVAGLPKVLAEVAGRPFLAHLLDRLAAAGVARVVLCTGYMADRVEEVFGAQYAGMSVAYSHEPAPLGTAGALRFALPLLDAPSVLALNGDSLWDLDLRDFRADYDARGAEAEIALAELPDASRYGRVQTDERGRIVRFEEKGAPGPGWVNMGLYLLSRRLLETVPAGRCVSIEREIFPAWIGERFYGFRHRGDFLDIGTPESYRAAESFLAR